MALQKTLALPTGVSGDYFRMVAFAWDRGARKASAHFALYKDAATAAAGAPLVPIVAKLRLSEGQFDAYLAPAALAAAEADVVGQLYRAAKEVSVAYGEEPTEPQPGVEFRSDYGRDLFADAVDA